MNWQSQECVKTPWKWIRVTTMGFLSIWNKCYLKTLLYPMYVNLSGSRICFDRFNTEIKMKELFVETQAERVTIITKPKGRKRRNCEIVKTEVFEEGLLDRGLGTEGHSL